MYWINLIGSAIISMLITLIFMCHVSSIEFISIFKTKKAFVFIVLNILFFLNISFMNDVNKMLLNVFIFVLLNILLIFNFDYKKSIFYAMIFFSLSCIVEIITMISISFLFHFTKTSYDHLTCGMLIFTTLNSSILYIISRCKKFLRVLESVYLRISNRLKSFLLLFFITAYIILLSYKNFIILKNDIDNLLNLGMLIIVLVTICFVTYNSIQKSRAEDKYNQMLEYVSKYESIINEQGKRNHEFNNQLMVLQGYINDKKKLKEYLNIIIDDQKGGQNFRIKQLGYLPDGGLKGLLYYKLSKMEEKKIKSFLYVNQNLKNSFKNISVDFYRDITKIFGVFIDNAIDAASEADKKEIVIDIRKDDDSLIIIINNTYKENNDINKVGKKGYTSKGNGHGFGLSLVSDITKRNDQIESFSDIENGMFKQTLIIYLK